MPSSPPRDPITPNGGCGRRAEGHRDKSSLPQGGSRAWGRHVLGTEQLCARCATGLRSAAAPLWVPPGMGVLWGHGEGAAAPQAAPRGAGETRGSGTEMERKRDAQWLSGTIVFMADNRFTDTGAVRGRTEPPKHAAPPQRYEIIYRNNGGAENPLPCPAENGAPPGTLAQHPVCPDPERQGGAGAQPTAGMELRYHGRNAPRGRTAPGGSAAPGQPRSPALPPGGFRGTRPLRAADNTTTTHAHTQTTTSAAGPPAGHTAPPMGPSPSPGTLTAPLLTAGPGWGCAAAGRCAGASPCPPRSGASGRAGTAPPSAASAGGRWRVRVMSIGRDPRGGVGEWGAHGSPHGWS